MAADIAICSGANQHQSLHYLKVAKNFLANLTKRTSSSTTALIDTDVLAHLNAYLDRLETLLTTDLSTACAIGSVAIESALAKRLSLSESFPSEQSALRGYLQLHSSLRAAAESLHAALNANGMNFAISFQMLQQIFTFILQKLIQRPSCGRSFLPLTHHSPNQSHQLYRHTRFPPQKALKSL